MNYKQLVEGVVNILLEDDTSKEPWETHEDEYTGPFTADTKYEDYSAKSKTWRKSAEEAISLGKVDPDTMRTRNYFGSSSGNNWEILPKKLYHVTTNAETVEREGLKTRSEMDMGNGHGLGGGASDAISFTDKLGIAKNIHRAMHEMHATLTGKFTLADMMEHAKKGTGAKAPFVDEFTKSLKIHGDVDQLSRSIRTGMGIDGPPTPTSYDPTEYAWRPHKDSKGWIGGDGQVKHAAWERDTTEDEKLTDKYHAYQSFSLWRELAGGPEDPLFFSTDIKAFAAKNPEKDFAVLEFEPVHDKVKGIRMSALGELRVPTGKAVKFKRRII